ncbi:hypothetical protein LZ30DRAFT_257864 [Colletotrichum cereale]|nr:hypothetical protein LZ30DRAFT_257864 [Colletotrichum cereale]
MAVNLPHISSGSPLVGVPKPHESTAFSSTGSGVALVPGDSRPATEDTACVECPEITSDSPGFVKVMFSSGSTSPKASIKEFQYPKNKCVELTNRMVSPESTSISTSVVSSKCVRSTLGFTRYSLFSNPSPKKFSRAVSIHNRRLAACAFCTLSVR